jgi:hypothetical protein
MVELSGNREKDGGDACCAVLTLFFIFQFYDIEGAEEPC